MRFGRGRRRGSVGCGVCTDSDRSIGDEARYVIGGYSRRLEDSEEPDALTQINLQMGEKGGK